LCKDYREELACTNEDDTGWATAFRERTGIGTPVTATSTDKISS
jgi:hypothetical protein